MAARARPGTRFDERSPTSQVDVLAPYCADTRFGIRLTVHATAHGPWSAPAISESLVDGVIAAFHAAANRSVDDIAAILEPHLKGSTTADLAPLIGDPTVPSLFAPTAFLVSSGHLQISPCDHLCDAGQVTIKTADATGSHVEISGELFTLRPAARDPAFQASPPAILARMWRGAG